MIYCTRGENANDYNTVDTYTVNNILKVLPDPNFKVNAEHPFGYSNIFIYAYLKNKKYKTKFENYPFVFFQSNKYIHTFKPRKTR